MKLYLDSDLIRLWDVLLKGWELPKGIIDSVKTTLSRSHWTNDQKEEDHKNKKVMTIMLASISREKGGKV